MKVLILSTSPRKESNTLKIAKALEQLSQEKGHVTKLVNFEDYDIPMIGQGSLDKDNLTDFQSSLIGAMEWAQVIVLAAPEYNWMTSGQLINAIHQIGSKEFAHLFDNKVFSLVGVSAGRGGRLPCIELMMLVNKMINFLDQYSVVSPRIFESHETQNNVQEDGTLTPDTVYTRTVHLFLDYTFIIANRWFKE
jgi:chromate reductase